MSAEKKKKRASVTVDARVPVGIAWRGVTDSRELQIWFAQQATLETSEERRSISFSGKYLPFLKYEEKPEQTFIEVDEKKHTVAFSWPIRTREGDLIDSEVRFTVSPINEFSRIDVEHTIGTDDISDDDLRNLWSILLNGLVFHMEGSAAWVRPEFTPKKGKEFKFETWIAAKRSDVYDTLTTVDGIKGFFAPKAKDIKLEEDGVIDLGWDKLPIKEVEENTKFVFGWREVADEDPNLLVTWELKDEGNGTRLSLTEGEFAESVTLCSRADYVGWAAVMNDLKRFIETKRHPIFLSIMIEEVK